MKDKIYIDFIGLPGAGKTKLRKKIFHKAKKENIDIFYRSCRINYFYFLFLMVRYPTTTLRIFYFWGKYKRKKGGINFGRRNILISNFLFYKSKSKYFLDESFFHSELNNNVLINKEDFKILKKLFPTDNLFFVFINTPADIAYKRMIQRKGFIPIEKIIKKKGARWGVSYFKKSKQKIKYFYILFQEIGGKSMVINGEKAIEKNAEIVTKKIKRIIG